MYKNLLKKKQNLNKTTFIFTYNVTLRMEFSVSASLNNHLVSQGKE